jgi:hypothetical protein
LLQLNTLNTQKSNLGTHHLHFRKKEERRSLHLRTAVQGPILRPNHSIGSAATRDLRRSIQEEEEEAMSPAHMHNSVTSFLTTTLYPGGIRSHSTSLQSPRRQAETIPLCRSRRQGKNQSHLSLFKLPTYMHFGNVHKTRYIPDSLPFRFLHTQNK